MRQHGLRRTKGGLRSAQLELKSRRLEFDEQLTLDDVGAGFDMTTNDATLRLCVDHRVVKGSNRPGHASRTRHSHALDGVDLDAQSSLGSD
jgi:hypothetical protein